MALYPSMRTFVIVTVLSVAMAARLGPAQAPPAPLRGLGIDFIRV